MVGRAARSWPVTAVGEPYSVSMLSPGDRFEGYIVEAALGHGGYATVYRAHHAAGSDRALALKVLDEQHRHLAQLARLRREFEHRRSAGPSAHRHRVRTRAGLALHGAGLRRHRRHPIGDARSTCRANTDRRCPGLHSQPGNCALRRQAVQYSYTPRFFTRRRSTHRFRCRSFDHRRHRLSRYQRRSVPTVFGTGAAHRACARRGHRRVRISLHRGRTDHRFTTIHSEYTDWLDRRSLAQASATPIT